MGIPTAMAIGLVGGLVLFACSSDGGDVPRSGDVPEEEPASEEATADGGGDTAQVDESPVVADFELVDLELSASASSYWYTAGGVYAVVYTGVDPAEVGPVCPGNSIELEAGGFGFVSNAPLEEGDCPDLPTDPHADARLCDSVIVYTTVLPTDAEGLLTASFGGTDPDAGSGLSQVEADLAATPEIDPGAPAYSFPTSMVPEGEVTC